MRLTKLKYYCYNGESIELDMPTSILENMDSGAWDKILETQGTDEVVFIDHSVTPDQVLWAWSVEIKRRWLIK